MTSQRARLIATSVTLDPEQLRRLDALAARKRHTRSWIVRDAIARELLRNEHRAAVEATRS